MDPPPAALSIGTARRAQRNWPVRQTSMQAAPIGGRDLVDAAGRPGDAGIVDERVEPPERTLEVVEQAVDIGLRRRRRPSSRPCPDVPRDTPPEARSETSQT